MSEASYIGDKEGAMSPTMKAGKFKYMKLLVSR